MSIGCVRTKPPVFDIALRAKKGLLDGCQEFRLVVGETAWRRFKKIVDREYANGATGWCNYAVKRSPKKLLWDGLPRCIWEEWPVSAQKDYWERLNCVWLGYIQYKKEIDHELIYEYYKNKTKQIS